MSHFSIVIIQMYQNQLKEFLKAYKEVTSIPNVNLLFELHLKKKKAHRFQLHTNILPSQIYAC